MRNVYGGNYGGNSLRRDCQNSAFMVVPDICLIDLVSRICRSDHFHAHSLHLNAIAEDVESKDQAKEIRPLQQAAPGCKIGIFGQVGA
jgi:hypothetical protein